MCVCINLFTRDTTPSCSRVTIMHFCWTRFFSVYESILGTRVNLAFNLCRTALVTPDSFHLSLDQKSDTNTNELIF